MGNLKVHCFRGAVNLHNCRIAVAINTAGQLKPRLILKTLIAPVRNVQHYGLQRYEQQPFFVRLYVAIAILGVPEPN